MGWITTVTKISDRHSPNPSDSNPSKKLPSRKALLHYYNRRDVWKERENRCLDQKHWIMGVKWFTVTTAQFVLARMYGLSSGQPRHSWWRFSFQWSNGSNMISLNVQPQISFFNPITWISYCSIIVKMYRYKFSLINYLKPYKQLCLFIFHENKRSLLALELGLFSVLFLPTMKGMRCDKIWFRHCNTWLSNYSRNPK